jgi:transposase
MALKELQLIDEQIGQLDQEMASLLKQHQDAVQRLSEVPGLGLHSAQQIIAEVGATAATFASPKNVYQMLKYGQAYVDKGADYYEQRSRQQQIDILKKKAAQLGLQVALPQS